MTDKIVPSNLQKIAPLLKAVYQERLTDQLKKESVFYYGRVRGEWTPEELKRIEEGKAKREKERKELLELLATATGTVKAVLDLHSTDKYEECHGCDYGGYEGDRPSWPCRTVELIAESLREGK